MDTFLKAKTAGLPRWAWLTLLGGGVAFGLYLRHRNSEETEETEEEPAPAEDSLASYEGTESAGGLAAAGLVGPAQGQITPVEAPYIPEGFVDVFQSQSETTQDLIGALAEREPGERVETIREVEPIGEGNNQGVTGGGPSKRKPHHGAPGKPHHKKPHQKKQPHKRPPRKPQKKRPPRQGKHPHAKKHRARR